MKGAGHGSLLLTDSDIDALAWQFLNSEYVKDRYANWQLERRLEGFLRQRGLGRVADDGDICDVILDRVMTYKNACQSQLRRGHWCDEKKDTEMPERLTRRVILVGIDGSDCSKSAVR